MKTERGDIMVMYGRSALIGWIEGLYENPTRFDDFLRSKSDQLMFVAYDNLLLCKDKHQRFLAINMSASEKNKFPERISSLFKLIVCELSKLNPTGFRIDIEIPDEIWGKCLPILAFLPDCVHVWKYEKEDQLKLIDIK